MRDYLTLHLDTN